MLSIVFTNSITHCKRQCNVQMMFKPNVPFMSDDLLYSELRQMYSCVYVCVWVFGILGCSVCFEYLNFWIKLYFRAVDRIFFKIFILCPTHCNCYCNDIVCQVKWIECIFLSFHFKLSCFPIYCMCNHPFCTIPFGLRLSRMKFWIVTAYALCACVRISLQMFMICNQCIRPFCTSKDVFLISNFKSSI